MPTRISFYFKTNLNLILLVTPWFSLWISEGDRDFRRAGIWWGFQFEWAPKKDPNFEELWFSKSYRYESDFVSYFETVNRRGRFA